MFSSVRLIKNNFLIVIASKNEYMSNEPLTMKFKSNLATNASQILTKSSSEFSKTPFNDSPYKMPNISKNSSYLRFKQGSKLGNIESLKTQFKETKLNSNANLLMALNKTISDAKNISFNRYKRTTYN